jgi:hypothetical protein
MTNNKQQTAVWWLFSETLGITLQLANKRISHRNWELQMVKLYEQAKEMEKEQTIKTSLFWSHSTVKRKDIEDYYNETYGGSEQ